MSTPDFFRSRLDAMIDLRHPLAVLATKMSWASIETTLSPLFERRTRDGRVSEAVDLFWLELAGTCRWRQCGWTSAPAYAADGGSAVSEARLQRK